MGQLKCVDSAYCKEEAFNFACDICLPKVLLVIPTNRIKMLSGVERTPFHFSSYDSGLFFHIQVCYIWDQAGLLLHPTPDKIQSDLGVCALLSPLLYVMTHLLESF